MNWDIRFTFKDKSDADYKVMDDELQNLIQTYNMGGIEKELELTNNRYVVDDIRVHSIVKFRNFLKYVLELELIPEEGFTLTIEGCNKNEVEFWINFEKSLSDDVMNSNNLSIMVME